MNQGLALEIILRLNEIRTDPRTYLKSLSEIDSATVKPPARLAALQDCIRFLGRMRPMKPLAVDGKPTREISAILTQIQMASSERELVLPTAPEGSSLIVLSGANSPEAVLEELIINSACALRTNRLIVLNPNFTTICVVPGQNEKTRQDYLIIELQIGRKPDKIFAPAPLMIEQKMLLRTPSPFESPMPSYRTMTAREETFETPRKAPDTARTQQRKRERWLIDCFYRTEPSISPFKKQDPKQSQAVLSFTCMKVSSEKGKTTARLYDAGEKQRAGHKECQMSPSSVNRRDYSSNITCRKPPFKI